MCWGSDRRFIWEKIPASSARFLHGRGSQPSSFRICVSRDFFKTKKSRPTDHSTDGALSVDTMRNGILRRRRIQAQLKVSTTVTDAPWERSVRYKRNVKRQRSNRHIKSTAAPIKDLMSRSWYTCYAAWNFNKIKPLLVMRKETQSLG